MNTSWDMNLVEFKKIITNCVDQHKHRTGENVALDLYFRVSNRKPTIYLDFFNEKTRVGCSRGIYIKDLIQSKSRMQMLIDICTNTLFATSQGGEI